MAHEDPIRPNALHPVRPSSLNIVRDQEATMELRFHGSCSRCHHLHTNRPLKYFLNIKKHLRFKCERCQRDMFGLGNNSTQTTLASQETLSPRSSWLMPPGSTNVTRASSTDLETMRHARQSQDLGTIAENTSLDGRSVDGTHRPVSSIIAIARCVAESSDGDASRAQSITVTSPSIADESVANVRLSDETLECHDQPPLGIPPRRFRKWKDKISRWIGRWRGTKIEVTLGYPTLKVSREPTRENPHRSVCQGTQSQPPRTEQTATILSMSQTHRSQALPSTPAADGTHSRGEEHAAEPSDGAVETAEDEASAQAAKRERIKAQRREKTEKSKASENPICQCPEECHCRQPMHSSGIDSDGHGHSITTSDVPGHPLGHIWSGSEADTNADSAHRHRRSWSPIRHVAFTGAGAWMNQPAARNHHHSEHSDSWDSQATTAASNESSISLEGIRPAARRSHSLPPIRELLHRHGPVIRDALRDDAVHSQFQNLARQARNSDSPPVTQDSTRVKSGITLATEMDSNHGGIDGTIALHASSTSLANLAAPDSDGQLDHSSSRGLSVHSRMPSPEINHAPGVSTTDNVETSSVPLNDGLPNGSPSTSPQTVPDVVATDLDHVGNGTSTPSTLRLPLEHRITSSLTDHDTQSTSGEEDDSTSIS